VVKYGAGAGAGEKYGAGAGVRTGTRVCMSHPLCVANIIPIITAIIISAPIIIPLIFDPLGMLMVGVPGAFIYNLNSEINSSKLR